MTDVLEVTNLSQLMAAAQRGAELLRQGCLVAFPTETVYGLAACASNDAAMERLRDLKSRPERPFTVHIGHPKQAYRFVAQPPVRAERIMRKLWPGPVTLVLPTHGRLSEPSWMPRMHDVLCYQNTIGLRCPAHPVSEQMLSLVEEPVVAPSANPAGLAPPTSAQEVLAKLDGQIDLVIDAGATRLAKASTIIVFHEDGKHEIVREGSYDQRMLEEAMRKRILFVCTGNTCRSPMAEALTKLLLAEEVGCTLKSLPTKGLEVISAGTATIGGQPASPNALQAVRQLGGDMAPHRSQSIYPELINSADLIFCMSDYHRDEVVRLAPEAADRTLLLDPDGQIPDPIGSDLDVYRRVAERIRHLLTTHWMEVLK